MLTRADLSYRVQGIKNLIGTDEFISKNFQKNVIVEEVETLVDIMREDGVRVSRGLVMEKIVEAADATIATDGLLILCAERSR